MPPLSDGPPNLPDNPSLDPASLVRHIAGRSVLAAGLLAPHLPAMTAIARRALECLARGGRLVYAGAGASGRIAVIEAAECVATFGDDGQRIVGIIAGGTEALWRTLPDVEDCTDLALKDIQSIEAGPNDFVVGLSASGTTPWTLAVLELATGRGAATALVSHTEIANTTASSMQRLVVPIPPEFPVGASRMNAGTVTKVIVNILGTTIMTARGNVHNGRMIAVRAWNQKLRERSIALLQNLAGVDVDAAQEILDRTGGETDVALVALLLSQSPEQARSTIDQSPLRTRTVITIHEARNRQAHHVHGTHVVGVDAGGTKVAAMCRALNREDSSVSEGRGGPGNISSDPDTARHSIATAIDHALDRAGIGLTDVAAVCIAAAGAGNDEARTALQDWIKSRYKSNCLVINDAEAVLAASDSAAAVGVIAGTGSIVLGRSATGTRERSGGWGWRIADDGSAYAIGVAALRHLARILEEPSRGASTMQARILARHCTRDVRTVLNEANRIDTNPSVVAALAEDVLRAADEDRDIEARELVEAAAKGLAHRIVDVAKRIVAPDKSMPLCLAGRLLVAVESFRCTVLDAVTQQWPAPLDITLVDRLERIALDLARRSHDVASASAGFEE